MYRKSGSRCNCRRDLHTQQALEGMLATAADSHKLLSVAPCAADSGIPHTLETVQELMNLIDIDRGGITDWHEFQSFVANELESGAAHHGVPAAAC